MREPRGAAGDGTRDAEGGRTESGDRGLDAELRHDLRHRIRPVVGHRREESATPLELFYDLVYVIAFGVAAEQLAGAIAEGHAAAGVGAFLFAVFGVTWAWLNFTWFSAAYGNDDALFRVATVVQMVGVVIYTFGLPGSFEAAASGENPNDGLLVVGYVIMRVPLIALWMRAARADPERRRTALAYAGTISVAQVGWVLAALPGAASVGLIGALVVLAAAEMIAPVVIEKRFGRTPWRPQHVAERFGLLTLITLGEVVAATVAAVGALVGESGWSVPAAGIAASGLLIAAGLWWAYYLIPSRAILVRWPERVWLWRYVHLPLFGAIAAVGAGLRVAAEAVQEEHVPLWEVTLALAVPVAIVMSLIFLVWSVLVRSFDLSHLPLYLLTMAPTVVAVVLALTLGHGHDDISGDGQVGLLVVVVALVSLSCVIEVVGHEIVGYRHTVRAVARSRASA